MRVKGQERPVCEIQNDWSMGQLNMTTSAQIQSLVGKITEMPLEVKISREMHPGMKVLKWKGN